MITPMYYNYTLLVPSLRLFLVQCPGPSTVFPSSSGPHDMLYMSMWSLLNSRDRHSTVSDMLASNILIPDGLVVH